MNTENFGSLEASPRVAGEADSVRSRCNSKCCCEPDEPESRAAEAAVCAAARALSHTASAGEPERGDYWATRALIIPRPCSLASPRPPSYARTSGSPSYAPTASSTHLPFFPFHSFPSFFSPFFPSHITLLVTCRLRQLHTFLLLLCINYNLFAPSLPSLPSPPLPYPFTPIVISTASELFSYSHFSHSRKTFVYRPPITHSIPFFSRNPD